MGGSRGGSRLFQGRTLAYKLIAVLVSAVMAVSLCPIANAYADTEQEAESHWYDNIDQMLDAGNYVEGEVVAVVSAGAEAAAASLNEGSVGAADSSGLLAESEDIMEASASSASLVLDSDFESGAQAAALSDGEDGSSTAEKPAVQIVLVKKEGVSTRDLLQQLAQDARVVSAEPNYVIQTADSEVSEDAVSDQGAGGDNDNGGNGDSLEGNASAASDEPAKGNASVASGESGQNNESTTGESAIALASDEGSDQGGNGTYWFDPSKPSQIASNDMPDITDYQWGNTGGAENVLTGSKESGTDAQVPGWNLSADNAGGIVCTVDTGIDYNHPDLKDNMVDLTDYVDKIGGGKYGINTSNDGSDENDPMDVSGHGTHVAGIIAAQWDNSGTSGAAKGVQLMSVKIGTDSGMSLEAALKGYAYISRALDAGVDIRVINNSWGADGTTVALNLAMTEVGKKGAISVCASGNDSRDIDSYTLTPTGTSTSPYTVIVNSSSANGEASLFSDWGRECTDLYAPGAMIMSTICQTKSTYMPWLGSASNNVAYDTYFTDDDGVGVYVGYGADAVQEQNKVKNTGDYGYHFDTSGSISITGKQLKTADQGATANAKHRYAVTLKIPVAKSDLDKVSCFGFSTTADTTDFSVVSTYYEAVDESGSAAFVRDQTCTARAISNIGWGSTSINLKDSLGWADRQQLVWHSNSDQASSDDGYMLVSLMFETQADSLSDDERVYLDCVGLGSTVAPYSLMNGTSMASPLAAASAAICSTKVDRSKPASERALELVSLLKSCTTQKSEFEGKCTSGGILDLSKLSDRSKAQPVISGATLEEGEGANYIVVEGACFGDNKGTVTVGGYSAQIVSWSGSSVKVEVPSEVTSGKREVVLTTASGKSCSNTMVVRFTENPPEGDVPLFEESISLDGPGFADQVQSTQIIGLNGYIYAFPQLKALNKDFESSLSFQSFYRYCIETGTWEAMGSLPSVQIGNDTLDKYATVSLALWEGKLLMLARTSADETLKYQFLFSYDPDTNEWTQLQQAGKNIPLGASIVNVEGTIVAIGGCSTAATEADPDAETSLESDSIASVDMQTGEVKPLGSLDSPRHNFGSSKGQLMQVAASGSTIYVTNGVCLNRSMVVSNNLPSERLVKQADGTYKVETLTEVLPETQFYYDYSVGLAAGTDGAAFSSLKVTESDEDTFLVSNSASTAIAFGKKAYDTPLSYATSLAYHGKLYTIGLDEFNGGSAVMRATAFNTPEHPAGELSDDPDPSPSPAPDPTPSPSPAPDPSPSTEPEPVSYSDGDGNAKSTSAKTDDASRSIAAVASFAAFAALATAAFCARRRRIGE